MILYSTNNPQIKVDLKKAVIEGLAEDGGLYMPEKIPELKADFFTQLKELSFQEIAFAVSKNLIQGAITDQDLEKIVKQAINFDAPIVQIDEQTWTLELFHGPTCAFKDFGARFMSRLVSYFAGEEKITVLAATSGDTGSAVAHGFFNLPNVQVILLYPSGKVSHIQEQQLTTMGANVTALEIDGRFDDCQSMVKAAFNDAELNKKYQLTSANSINIARLIPQSFYYFHAIAQLQRKGQDLPPIFSVPSGNFGNLTAGLFAKKMGLKIKHFIAATNINDTFPRYLQSGKFEARPSIKTISNAMDVGNPSNAARIFELYKDSDIHQDISGYSFTDQETKEAMQKVYQKSGYLMDPHAAVAWLGLQTTQYQGPKIFLETAHPAKFGDTVEEISGKTVEIPERLAQYLERQKQSIKLGNTFEELKEFLLSC